MTTEIIVPRLGWSMEEGAFVAWLKKDGELVRAGEPLFSIEGDKAIQEIESIDSGVLRISPQCPKPGDAVRVGDVLGWLVDEESVGAGATEMRLSRTTPEPAEVRTAAECNPAQLSTPHERAEGTTSASPAISPRARRRAKELGVDWGKLSGSGRGGRIRERDIVAAARGELR